ncbi:hypothetical protein, partial [Poseidonibacter lekithochrous]
MVGNFLCDAEIVAKLLDELIQKQHLSDLALYRAQQLLREMNNKERTRSVHFDEDFVEKLLTLPNIPELIRTSPLTQREW